MDIPMVVFPKLMDHDYLETPITPKPKQISYSA